VDQVVPPEKLLAEAAKSALALAGAGGPAFPSIKRLLRGPVAEVMVKREPDSIAEFVEIWYADATWDKLKKIKIRD